ncbi:MAG: pknB 8, partial [Phycisphaerales bacterium]|nr:pknB 8 [Phycisphaerales bacterium]
VRRQVALKIIKPGMGSDQVIARFQAERQALERMDHPNIARVLDAGTTQSGLPYFVMELVEGVPITGYCDERRLTPRQRLELFVPVCHAVQHAHQKGIIHRDIKPSNVLVATYDGKPVPKVIDFGVATAVEKLRAEQTAFTRLGVLVGTPEYMSPEQADLDAGGVDTRSDIYSLGVVLYELLTGTTPLEVQRLREAGWAQMLKSIREEQPPRPSTRLSGSGAARAEISARRGTEAKRLQRLLTGDLDQVVMKALEKECDRRYQTANGLARDIERYLEDEPVEARGPSAAYKLRKFAHKHRASLAAAAGFAALLTAGTAASTWQAVRARHAEEHAKNDRDRAVSSEAAANLQRDKANAERKRADEQAATVIAINRFFSEQVLGLASPIAQAGPDHPVNPKLTIREALDRAAAHVGTEFAKRPAIEIPIRSSIGRAYYDLGEYSKAYEQWNTALTVGQSAHIVEHDQIVLMENLSTAEQALGHFARAETLLLQALEQSRRLLGANDETTLGAMHGLVLLYVQLGRTAEAEPLNKQVLERLRKTRGDKDPGTLSSLSSLGRLYLAQGRYAEAKPLFEEAFESSRSVLGREHPLTFSRADSLGRVYDELGKVDSAEAIFRETFDGCREALGPNHPRTITAAVSLAAVYTERGQMTDAEVLLSDTLPRSIAVEGEYSLGTLTIIGNLAVVCDAQGRLDEGDALFCRELNGWKRIGQESHPKAIVALTNLSAVRRDQGRYAEAESGLKKALALAEQKMGKDHPDTLRIANYLGRLYREQFHYAQAEPLFQRQVEACRRTLGDRNPLTLQGITSLGFLYTLEGRYAQATSLFKEASAGYFEPNGPPEPLSQSILLMRATLSARQGRLDEAESLIEQFQRTTPRKLVDPDPVKADARRRLAGIRAARQAEVQFRKWADAGAADSAPALDDQMAWAVALRDADALDESERQARAVAEGRRRLNDAAGVFEARMQIAKTHRMQHRDMAAEEEFAALLAEARHELGDQDPVVDRIGMELIECCRDVGLFDRRALNDLLAAFGPDGRNGVAPFTELAGILVDKGSYPDAEVLLREAIRIFERDNPHSWHALMAKCRLGGSLAGQKKFAEGETLLLGALTGLKANPPRTASDSMRASMEVRRRLAVLYEAWGKPDEAERWQRTLWAQSSPPRPATNPTTRASE